MVTLELKFYLGDNVLDIAKALLGKVICTNIDGRFTSARIVETEAYNGVTDKASHAYGHRNTRRTEVMYRQGGAAYVYLCYGIHHLFNVVTNVKGTPHAVLIRAGEPVAGIPIMLQRTGKLKPGASLTRGPGNVSKALGITTSHTGLQLKKPTVWIANDGMVIMEDQIKSTPRIGVDYAGEDASLPYRFFIKGNKYVSGNKWQNGGEDV